MGTKFLGTVAICGLLVISFQNCSGSLDSPSEADFASVRAAQSDRITLLSVPSDAAYFQGSRMALAVTAVSQQNLPLSYRWTKDGHDLHVDSSLLDIPSVAAADAGRYVCRVSNGTQSVETAVNVTVSQLPVITISAQPQPLTLTAGGAGTLSVTAVSDNGSALTYQWYKDDQAVAGATTSSLALTNVTLANGGSYHVKIQSSAGAASVVKSNVVKVFVRTTYTIASNECNGARCGGGYDGTKNADPGAGRDTTDYLCKQRGNTAMVSFTLGGQPGGRFCAYNAAAAAWGCDPSCSGCNTVATVTCTN